MIWSPPWTKCIGWLALCIFLTIAMVIVANAETVMVCDFDVVAHGLLKPEDYGLKLKRQYYDERARVWIAEYENDSGALVVVTQSFGQALDAEWRQ